VSVVCPAFGSATATLRVAAVATGPGLRTASVTAPGQATDASGLRVVNGPGAPLRVSAILPDAFGAATVVTAEAGADRGLSASACVAPATDHWFAGVDIRPAAQSEVVVANLDETEAAVDILAYGEKGRIAAPRGVRVAGNSVATISLGTLERTAGPITLEVSSSDGRVAAFVRQRTWQLDVPLGAEWLPEAVAPAAQLVVPGVPAGAGGRSLVVTNPGERTATLTVAGLTRDGTVGLPGIDQVEVPPGTTRTVALETGLDQQSAALTLASTEPVTAAIWLDAGGGDARRDPAYAAAVPPLPADSIWPVPLGRGATSVLQLANPGTTPATATVTLASGSDPGQAQEVTVPAGAVLEIPLLRASTDVVRVQPKGDLRGAVVATAKLGKVRGITVVGLVADVTRGEAPVVFDPHTGS
jgi:P pilus assembly chaperone PapD